MSSNPVNANPNHPKVSPSSTFVDQSLGFWAALLDAPVSGGQVGADASGTVAADFRARQLRLIFPLLQPSEHAILMGDFNFCSSTTENANILPAYLDLWPALHPSDPGYTENTDINRMRANFSGKHPNVRIDRVLLRSAGRRFEGRNIRLLGTSPISAELPDAFPSDHFGLCASLNC